jgi:hypothetical protein
MAKNPAHRYQTPAEMIDAVNDLVLSGGLKDEDEATAHDPDSGTARSSTVVDQPTNQMRVPPMGFAAVAPDWSDGRRGPAVGAGFRELWDEWFAVLDRMVRGEPPHISDGEYKTLYRDLMGAIRAAQWPASASPSGWPPGDVASLVEPWVSLGPLAGLDGHMRTELWRDCQSAAAALWPDPPLPPRLSPRILPVACGVLCVFGFGAIALGPRWSAVTLNDLLRSPLLVAVALLSAVIVMTVVVSLPKGERV